LTRERIQAAVVDTSVFADYYLLYHGRPERHEKARAILDRLSSPGFYVYEPFLFEVELRAVLVRRIKPEQALEAVDAALQFVNVVGEEAIHDRAAEIALFTGCRAVDAYYIAAAKHANAILVTNDRTMKYNALKARVEAYYLLSSEDYTMLVDYLMTS